MSRALLIINSDADRRKASAWCLKAPPGTRIEFKQSKRSTPQNDRMWAHLTDLASHLDWHGIKLSADDWKLIMLDALKREVRMVPNVDGNGFVSLGRSSSDLTKSEMSDLLDLIAAFGATHGVKFQEQSEET